MDKVRFGIIGLGNMGSNHAKSFTDNKITNGILAAVADNDKRKIDSVKQKLGDNVKYFNSAEELIQSGTIDAVIIATPHYSHPELSIKALYAGLNVICEKPAGVYTKQVKQMNEAAKNSKGLFTVMFNQRTNCLYRKMKEIIQNGGIGELKRVNWIITNWYRSQNYYDSSDWRATWAGEGGGVLANQCPHQLDLLQWVIGEMPKSVRAFCHFGKWHDIETEDDVTAYFEYQNGATGAFITSTADCPGTNRLEIIGTKGKLICEKENIEFYSLKTDEREFNSTYKGGFGEPESLKQEVKLDGQNPQHIGIINNFANSILGKEKLFVDGKEGLKGVQLMNAMLLSTWLNKTIEIPFNDELYYRQLKKRIKKSKPKNRSSVALNVEGTYGGSK